MIEIPPSDLVAGISSGVAGTPLRITLDGNADRKSAPLRHFWHGEVSLYFRGCKTALFGGLGVTNAKNAVTMGFSKGLR